MGKAIGNSRCGLWYSWYSTKQLNAHAVVNMADSEFTAPVTIIWKDYCKALQTGIWSLFKDQLLVDVSLTCHQQGLKVHRLILAVFFPGLKESLLQAIKPLEDNGSNDAVSQQLQIDLNLGLSSTTKEENILNLLMEFAYSGNVTVPRESLESVLAAAEQLGFEGLVNSIKEHNVSVTSYTEVDVQDVTDFFDIENGFVEDTDHLIELATSKNGTMVCIPTELQFKAAGEPASTTDKAEVEKANRQTVSNPSDTLQEANETQTNKRKKRNVCYVDSLLDSDDESERLINKPIERKIEDDEEWTKEDEEWSKEDEEWNKTKVIQRKTRSNRSSGGRKSAGPTQKRIRARLRCEQCDYSTSDKPSYLNHIAKHDPSVEVTIFTCKLCSKEFRSKNGYLCHRKTHGNRELLYNCDHCSFSTPQKWSYYQHLAVLHKLDENGKPLTEKITCDQCDFTCVAAYQLKSHKLRKHTLDKPFKCKECDHSAKTRGDLNNHIQVRHCKERSFMCDTCGFRCQTQSLLNRHRHTHSGVKPFKCQLCGMEYATSQKYKYHLERHASDDKPFVCHICGHSSRRKDNLKMHLKRVHHVTALDTDVTFQTDITENVLTGTENILTGIDSGTCVALETVDMIITTAES